MDRQANMMKTISGNPRRPRRFTMKVSAALAAAIAMAMAGCAGTAGPWGGSGATVIVVPEQRGGEPMVIDTHTGTAKPIEAAAPSPVAPLPKHPAADAVDNTQYTAADDRKSITPMGLYGDMNRTGGSATSPMDSPNGMRQVTFATEGADFDPEVDPTGQWLAIASTRHRKTADIYLQKIGGSAVTQLTSDPGNDVMPTFSPDGKYIAFASDRSGNWDIYLKQIGGGQPIKLTNNPTNDLHPSFSPDGKKLIYCSYGSRSGQWELVMINLNRPDDRRFVAHGLFPNWSPAGDKIVFQRSRARGTRWFSVWTLDVDEKDNVARPTEIAASSNAAAITPHWSPDGKFIVFCTVLDPQADKQKQPAQADVWLITADGRGRTNLTNSPFANVQPVWSPNGTVFFVSNRSRNSIENIWSLRPDSAMMALNRALEGTDNVMNASVKKAGGDNGLQPINPSGPVDNGQPTAIVPTP